MNFDKQYSNRKDRRKQPYKRKNRDCRPHGSCSRCFGDRLHKHRRRAPSVSEDDQVSCAGNEEGESYGLRTEA